MSTTMRPLEQIKREQKAAHRAPHLRKQNLPAADPIDVLDNVGIGPSYHHDGPYDATLASRNAGVGPRYAPVDAVRETNAEALKATPRDHVEDSLRKHVPLAGTASVPPGMRDLSGQVMDYEEGADLMREPDAEGGAYKRWDHVQYHPDDLKGKGEPSYTIERDLAERERRMPPQQHGRHGTQLEYEMQPQSPRSPHARNGSKDHGASASVTGRSRGYSAGSAAGPSSPTGKRLSDGIKRRFGSLRNRRADE
ncbi:hypothetical protein F5Y15DRAFT_269972 [Xylariaceae sp. FL0016]|nr:hypothetical protein F5Y15DRAFT_269972 [Xylariaceae sp. FL0016]